MIHTKYLLALILGASQTIWAMEMKKVATYKVTESAEELLAEHSQMLKGLRETSVMSISASISDCTSNAEPLRNPKKNAKKKELKMLLDQETLENCISNILKK